MKTEDNAIPILIAEIGVNYYDIATVRHLTPLAAATVMLEEAKRAGADIAKFQTYKADKLAAEHSPAYWDTTEETTRSQRELFAKFDKLSLADYRTLAEHAQDIGIEFMSTAFDVDSASGIDPLVLRHKIASADITNVQLLTKIASFGKPVIMSTGASTVYEIQWAVDVLRQGGAGAITLLHCVLCYPTAPHQARLRRIADLAASFPDCEIGYSDHTKSDARVLTTAYLLGATVIEKHFTLDKSLKGNDHYHAADPEDLIAIRREMAFVRTILGNHNQIREGGDEEAARLYARRGVYLVRNATGGEVVREADVEYLRPQLDGLGPSEWRRYVELRARYKGDLERGRLISAVDIEL